MPRRATTNPNRTNQIFHNIRIFAGEGVILPRPKPATASIVTWCWCTSRGTHRLNVNVSYNYVSNCDCGLIKRNISDFAMATVCPTTSKLNTLRQLTICKYGGDLNKRCYSRQIVVETHPFRIHCLRESAHDWIESRATFQIKRCVAHTVQDDQHFKLLGNNLRHTHVRYNRVRTFLVLVALHFQLLEMFGASPGWSNCVGPNRLLNQTFWATNNSITIGLKLQTIQYFVSISDRMNHGRVEATYCNNRVVRILVCGDLVGGPPRIAITIRKATFRKIIYRGRGLQF